MAASGSKNSWVARWSLLGVGIAVAGAIGATAGYAAAGSVLMVVGMAVAIGAYAIWSWLM